MGVEGEGEGVYQIEKAPSNSIFCRKNFTDTSLVGIFTAVKFKESTSYADKLRSHKLQRLQGSH